ncbi:MAG TPA: reverse transcriptase family protein, partial [Aquella sp.]|nr:reverse transcriptase family protein [Aquella sp.]
MIVVYKRDVNGKIDKTKPRLVADYSRLNTLTSGIVHFQANTTDILEQLSGACLYSSIDLKESYHQIQMDPRDVSKTSISTHVGTYEFVCANYGLKSAGSFLQKALNVVFSGLSPEWISVFVDDILLYTQVGDPVEKHLEYLDKTLQCLASYGFLININKCKFLQKQIEFLGLELGNNSSTIAERNVKVIRDMKFPENRKALKRVLGFFGFYRRYVSNFSKRVTNLRDLANSDKTFIFNDNCKNKFNDLRECLMSKPILTYYNAKYPVILKTDASKNSLGAILSHVIQGEEHPIAYASRVLKKHERLWKVQDQEAYSIIWALEYFKFWLINHEDITIYTDNHNLCYLQAKADKSGRYGRWLIRLNMFKAKLVHRKAEKHVDVDCISRLHADGMDDSPTFCGFVGTDDWEQAYEND